MIFFREGLRCFSAVLNLSLFSGIDFLLEGVGKADIFPGAYKP